MAKAKTGGLLDRVKLLPPKERGRKLDWYGLLQKNHPEQAAELEELIVDWIGGGESTKVFPTLRSLFDYLYGENLIAGVGMCSFRMYVKERNRD